jgi:biotin operon repressor
MFDDGDLINHGDEIKGDRIYSNIFGFYKENETVIPLKIVVTTLDDTQYTVEFNLNLVEDISEEYYQGSIEVFDLSEQKLNEIMEEPPADVENCLMILGDYLIEQTDVVSYEVLEDTLKFTFNSGLFSIITLREEGSTIESGGSFSKNKNSSFVDSFNERIKEKNIPLQEQTTGKNIIVFEPNEEDDYFVKSGENEDVEYIGNRSVFIWDPFHTWHTDIGYNNIESFSNIFNDSGQFFSVVTYADHEADVDSLKEITDYGIVIFSTHGSGYSIVTGEVAYDATKYNDEVRNFEMWIAQDMVVSVEEGIFTITKWQEPRWAVSTSWFDKKLSNDFPNSIIFNKSCKNGNQGFWEVFEDNGASTYYGNDNLSTVSFGTRKVEETLQGLVDGKTTGEAYIEESETIWHWDKIFSFPYKTTNTWSMFCKDDNNADNIKIPETIPFSNGGFEEDFTNWKKEGDGRIIYALAFIEPTEGAKMGIISTGLGYTEKYGSLSQTFKVGDNDTNLRFDWNYLSEEFLEWIGSQYQDPFKVTLMKVDDSSTTTLLNKTVDDIAAEFGASQSNGGDLIYVSPGIVFDIGDVWMTGWQNFEYDITPFRGKTVTLKFEAVDEGDEIFDTAILLDNIILE